MRDADGKTTRPFWPYFKAEQDQKAVQAGLPVPVNACWNGLTAFDARWFSNTTISPNETMPFLTSALTLNPPPNIPSGFIGCTCDRATDISEQRSVFLVRVAVE